MRGKAPERIYLDPDSYGWTESEASWVFSQDTIVPSRTPYIRADVADEWKRKMNIMQKALIEIEMFQGPAAYGRLPGMARKALGECGVKK